MRLSTLLAILCFLLLGLCALTDHWRWGVAFGIVAVLLACGTVYQIGAEGETRKKINRRITGE